MLLLEGQVVVCHRIVAILHGEKPGAEGHPEKGCGDIDAGYEEKKQQWNGANQEIEQFAQLRQQRRYHVLDDLFYSAGLLGDITAYVEFDFFRQQPVERRSDEICDNSEGIEDDQYQSDGKNWPQQPAKPCKPAIVTGQKIIDKLLKLIDTEPDQQAEDNNIDNFCSIINKLFNFLIDQNCDINTVFGTIAFITIETPNITIKPRFEDLKKLSNELLKLSNNKIRVIYGYTKAKIGTYGCEKRMSYFPVFPGFNNVINELLIVV